MSKIISIFISPVDYAYIRKSVSLIPSLRRFCVCVCVCARARAENLKGRYHSEYLGVEGR